MSQEQMANKLIDRTLEQRKKILENAEKKVANINAETKAETNRIKETTNEAIQNVIGGELRSVHDRIVGGAQLQSRKHIMEARTKLINNVFEQVSEEIRKIVEGPDYHKILVKLIAESVKKINEDCIVYANEEDTEYLKSVSGEFALGVKIKVEKSFEDIVGGVTIVNLEGTKTIHNTLDSRLQASRDRLTAEVAETLGVI